MENLTIANRQFLFWAGALALFIGFVLMFQAILLPFILGIAIAYLLNPAVVALRKKGVPRSVSALLILGGFLIVLILVLVLLLPLLYRESLDLASNIPSYIDSLSVQLEKMIEHIESITGLSMEQEFRDFFENYGSSMAGVSKEIFSGLIDGGQAVFGFLSVLVIMPIVAYFMMEEWPNLTEKSEDLMPRDHKNTIMDLLRQIDRKLAGFVRGQITVALVLAIGYAIALSIAGLKYGLLIGIGAGLLSVIPMIGSTIGLIVSVLVAWFQTGDWSFVLLIAGIFLGGQVIEGNFLTPKLVGDSVGLHPLWVFFALLAGGSLLGIMGMLIAVPVAAIVSVLVVFAISQYKKSRLYKGTKSPDPETRKNETP